MNKFHTDVPNDEWLSSKQRIAEEGMHKHKGITGSVTGWFDEPIKLPTRNIRFTYGLNGEHLYRDDVDSVKSRMLQRDVAEAGKFDTQKHPIFITVNHKGEGYISEGNHRLAYAVRNNIKHIHAEIRYYNGGERASGLFNPAHIIPSQVNESTEHPMIFVDGKQRHYNNSLGQPIRPTYEGVANFHRWFKDSKAVDEHGRPKVFYHGTGSDIHAFSHDYTGKGVDALGPGFYFTDQHHVAVGYADMRNESQNVIPVYLKVTKPIHVDSEDTFTHTQIKNLIQSAPGHASALENFGDVSHYGYHRVLADAVEAYRDIHKKNAMFAIANDFYGSNHVEFLKAVQRHTKHDAVIDSSGNSTVINVFHPGSIKSAIGNDGTFDHKTNITENLLLTESRIKDLKSQNPTINKIIDQYAQLDTSRTKKFVPWLVAQHKKGNVSPSQPDVAQVIQNFDKYKSSHGIADHSSKSFGEVRDAVIPLIGTPSTAKEKTQSIIHSGVDKIYETDGVQVYYVHSKKASQEIYGGGANLCGHHTNWCTASREGCRFGEYGHMYTVHIDGDKYSPYAVTKVFNASPDITSRHNEFSAQENYYSNNAKLMSAIHKIKDHFNALGESYSRVLRKEGSAEDIDAVSKFPTPGYRISVTNHPNVPVHVISRLSQDEDPLIRMKAQAMSHNTDSITEAYQQVRSITQETPEDNAYNERIAKVWKDTANKPWHEYATGMNLGGQEKDSPENEASKQRVKDYIEKHKHLFTTKNPFQR